MDVNERLRGYKRLDYDGRDCILVPLEDPLARRIKEEKLAAHQWNPNGFLIVDRNQLVEALKSGSPYRWESPEQKRRRLGHYERTREEILKEIESIKEGIMDAKRDRDREYNDAMSRGDSYDLMAVSEWGSLNRFIEKQEWMIDDLQNELRGLPSIISEPHSKRGRIRRHESQTEQFYQRKWEPEWWQHKLVRSALIVETSVLYNGILEMWGRHDLSQEESLWLMNTGDDAVTLLKRALDALRGPGEPTRFLTEFMRLPLPPALQGKRPYEDLYARTHDLIERANLGDDVRVSLALLESASMAEILESLGSVYDPTLDNLLKKAQADTNTKW